MIFSICFFHINWSDFNNDENLCKHIVHNLSGLSTIEIISRLFYVRILLKINPKQNDYIGITNDGDKFSVWLQD